MDNVKRRRHRPHKGAEKPDNERKPKTISSDDRGGRGLTTSKEDGPRYFSLQSGIVLLLAISAGIFHRYYLAMLFENDRHFTHLGEMEREMSFRSEMGFYYSFFKNLVDSPSFIDGIRGLLRDNRTEFGHEINDLKRFNLYPEVKQIISAALFRTYRTFANYFDCPMETCWSTFRGENVSPTMSCEGMGNKFYFYLNLVFALGGLLASLLFLFGYLLSESILGGIFTVTCFFFNHGQATRTMWTPSLRESFGYPIFLLLMFVVTSVVKADSASLFGRILVASCSCLFISFWQFASFPMSTMVLSLFLLNLFGYLSTKTFGKILDALTVGFLVALVLLFFNEMLLTSFYATSLFASALALLTEKVFAKKGLLSGLAKVLLFGVGTVALKVLFARLCSVTDDAHIFELLRSKFLGESTFHTYLYLCMREFDFLPKKDIVEMTETLLLPISIIVVLAAFKVFVMSSLFNGKRSTSWSTQAYAAVYYTCIQLACFLVMAGLVMRLKLFFTPHMCIICSLFFSPTFLSDVLGRPVSRRWSIIAGLLAAALMTNYGVVHILKELSVKGEFSDLKHEGLLLWIQKNTSPNAVFAGQMPMMSSILLSTGRPIVAHPHYEDAGLRKRVKTIYQMFSRKPVAEVHRAIAGMGADYLVIERNYCFNAKPGTIKNECYFPNAWDTEDPDNLDKEVCCAVMQRKPRPFKQVYENGNFIVFKL